MEYTLYTVVASWIFLCIMPYSVLDASLCTGVVKLGMSDFAGRNDQNLKEECESLGVCVRRMHRLFNDDFLFIRRCDARVTAMTRLGLVIGNDEAMARNIYMQLCACVQRRCNAYNL